MNIQRFYPVFEDGQVLTSAQLNDIVEYLEPQDRGTRSRMIGIGIICGFESDWDAASGTLALSHGVAATSEGYLIAEDDMIFDRVRDYTVPIPSAEEASNEQISAARYPFLFDGEDQHAALELLPDDFSPAPGENPPQSLSGIDLSNKTVLLFLERNLEALKNCDVNDCADKGSEMNLTLRRLLIDRSLADEILEEEADLTDRSVDRANHPRRTLAPISIAKLNPSGNQIRTLGPLRSRVMDTAIEAGEALSVALPAAWDAYRPLLEDMYPLNDFPNGPFPDHYLFNIAAAAHESPMLMQYVHGAIHDIARSYNEFIARAARFDAECAPAAGRFPLHILAGDVVARPTAFAGAPANRTEYENYDPLAAKAGPRPDIAERRHHFIPSPALDHHNDTASELRSLFARTVLLAQTFSTRDLLSTDIRLTPSRDGAAPLGERAIPFYYRFEAVGDLFGNWSWRKQRDGLEGSIFAYAFTDQAEPHPLALRQDDQDFIRIEGHVGKPLGTAWAELIRQRREHGVAFAIEPVMVSIAHDIAPPAYFFAQEAMRDILICEYRELDRVFAGTLGGLFRFLIWLIGKLGNIKAKDAKTRVPPRTGTIAGSGLADNVLIAELANFALAQPMMRTTAMEFNDFVELRNTSNNVRNLFTANALSDREIVAEIAVTTRPDDAADTTVAAIAAEMIRERDDRLITDRFRESIGRLDIPVESDEEAGRIFPAAALISRAQELLKLTSVDSFAEFDAPKFNAAITNFERAYRDYASGISVDAAADTELAATNVAIARYQPTISAVATGFKAFLIEEMEDLLAKAFASRTLGEYGRTHPGLEHKGGVPVGGTFVLLYYHRETVRILIDKILDDTEEQFSALGKLGGDDRMRLDEAKILEELMASSRPLSDDPLDELIVLGDLCLPYQCCADACGDDAVERRIQARNTVNRPRPPAPPAPRPAPPAPRPTPPAPRPAPPAPPAPRPTPPAPRPTPPAPRPTPPAPRPTPPPVGSREGTLEIRVFRRQGRRVIPVTDAQVRITRSGDRRSETFAVRAESHMLTLAAGDYALVAKTQSMSSGRETVTIRSGRASKIELEVKEGN